MKPNENASPPTVTPFESWEASVPRAFNAVNAGEILKKQSAILIKPNLVGPSPHPVTTAPECCEAVVRYIRSCSDATVVIAEGTGDAGLDTMQVYERLGYTAMAEKLGVALTDLNTAPLKTLRDPSRPFFPEIHLPEIAFTHFIVSLPLLKAHSLATITGTLKNMVGFAPPKFYAGQYGTWKKAVFHKDPQQAVADLAAYRTPDLTLLDATVGLAEYHLGGPTCSPPPNLLLSGFDPYAVDRAAAKLLGIDWRTVPHLHR